MDTWHRLGEITSLRFVARSSGDSGWNGAGTGTVEVERPDPSTIVFTESGTWKSDAGQQLKFSNVYRWTLSDSGNAIQLEHLRFGADNAVYLFDMAPESESIWRSEAPHVCRDDLYSAKMELAAEQIELQWVIKGPERDEDIHYWYS